MKNPNWIVWLTLVLMGAAMLVAGATPQKEPACPSIYLADGCMCNIVLLPADGGSCLGCTDLRCNQPKEIGK